MCEPGQSLFLPSNRRAEPGCFTLAASLLLASACTLATPSVRSASVDVAPRVIEVAPVVVRADTPPQVEDALAQAHVAWSRAELGRALELFDAAWRSAPRSQLAPWAMYWAACVVEQAAPLAADARSASRWPEAARRFAAVHERFPEHELALRAAVGAARIFTFIDDLTAARALGLELLAQGGNLTAVERVSLHGSVALGELARGNPDEAQQHVTFGRRVADRFRLGEAEVWSRDLAQLHFALGELRRVKAESLGFVPAPADFAERFEERAQTVLDAQSAYLDVMRARDAHWTSRAGLRIGELYQRLHSDVLLTEVPEAVPEERRELFLGAMRERFLVLLEKGVGILDRTVAMADRTGERSAWVALVRVRREEVARALDSERAAVDALPMSRADLQRVLAEIGTRQ
jgi:hypothetical protein